MPRQRMVERCGISSTSWGSLVRTQYRPYGKGLVTQAFSAFSARFARSTGRRGLSGGARNAGSAVLPLRGAACCNGVAAPASVPPVRCMTSSRKSKPGCHGRGVRPRAVRAGLSGAGSLPAPEQRCLAFGSDAPSRKRLTVDPADRHLHSPVQHERVRSARAQEIVTSPPASRRGARLALVDGHVHLARVRPVPPSARPSYPSWGTRPCIRRSRTRHEHGPPGPHGRLRNRACGCFDACCNGPRAMRRSRLPTLSERRRQVTSGNRLASGSTGLCIVQHETEHTSFARRLNTCTGGRP
jgi:hypothetical protein